MEGLTQFTLGNQTNDRLVINVKKSAQFALGLKMKRRAQEFQ